MPELKDFFTNMSVPMPIYKKLYPVFFNNIIKFVKRESYRGYQGEHGDDA
jgi:hypothetical protein